MYDTNGHLKQVIRVKCLGEVKRLYIGRLHYLLDNLNVKHIYDGNRIETDDIIIEMSLFDGYTYPELQVILNRRYSK